MPHNDQPASNGQLSGKNSPRPNSDNGSQDYKGTRIQIQNREYTMIFKKHSVPQD